MISISLPHLSLSNSFQTTNFKFAFIFALVILVTYSKKKEVVHTITSISTQCQITFIENQNLNQVSQDQKLIFKKCVRKQCQTYKTTSQCKYWQPFPLEEQKCYKECCGSQKYSEEVCAAYLEEKQIEIQASNRILIIVLASSITGVVVAIIFFAVCFMKCFKNNEKELQQQFRTKNGGAFSQNLQILWRPYKFPNDQNCQICNRGGAFIMLQCQQFYHLQCLNQLLQWKCTHCNQEINKARIFCLTCCKYYLTVKADSFEQLEKKISSGYEYHPERCYEQIISQIESDRKFTVSTKE